MTIIIPDLLLQKLRVNVNVSVLTSCFCHIRAFVVMKALTNRLGYIISFFCLLCYSFMLIGSPIYQSTYPMLLMRNEIENHIKY